MKTKRFLVLFFSVITVLGITLTGVTADEASPKWIADYSVTSSCGAANTALGSFNGSSACVNSSTGDLHYCTANFPYSELAHSLYRAFTDDYSWTADKMAEAMNKKYFMTLEDAREFKSLDVNVTTKTKNETPTLQGIQYFTEILSFKYSGEYMYDGRYDDGDSITSIDLSKNTKLKDLRLWYFSLEGIDLSANTALEYLELRHSTDTASSRNTKYNGLKRLKTLDLTGLSKLEDLYLFDQEIESLDLSQNTNLQYLNLRLMSKMQGLNIGENNILDVLKIQCCGFTELDLGDLPVVRIVNINTNKNLKTIDVTGLSAVKELDVTYNALEAIDLTNNTELEVLSANNNLLTELDVSKNTKLRSLYCNNNCLTSLDLSNNPSIKSINVNNQNYNIGNVVNDVYDLHNLPSGFDISKVKKSTTSDNTEYQFTCKQNGSYYNYDYVSVADDLLLSMKENNDTASYNYCIDQVNSQNATMSVTLKADKKYYTVSYDVPGITLRVFNYSGGAGEDIKSTTVSRGSSLRFVAEVDSSSPLYGKILAVFSQAEGGEKVKVSEYTYKETAYYSVSSINAPTVITVEEGHECVFGNWMPVENTSKHERYCTFEGCTEYESGYCSDYYGNEYHVNMTTMQKDCTRCGRQYSWQIDSSKSSHVTAKEPTCAMPGNVEFWICGHCNKYFADENCQHEVTPAEVYVDPLKHKYADGVCSECKFKLKEARFAQSPEDTFSSDDRYVYVLIGVGSNGKLYAMGEATGDGRRYGVEIPEAQIGKDGVITLSPEQAEFMDFEYYFENGATATSKSSFLVDGGYMSVLNGKIYTYPLNRLDDQNNARPFTFRQADYGDESGLGYVYGNVYDKENNKHTFEYMTFNAETHFFEACDKEQETIYLYRQLCDHEEIYVSHTYPVEPTCTEQGYSGEYWFCSMCETYFADENCTAEYVFPEEMYNIAEYFNVDALNHKFAENGVCENCGMKRPVYMPITTLEQFDKLSEEAYYIIVFKDGEKTYAAYIPNFNYFKLPFEDDSDGDGLIDFLEEDENKNGIPDAIEEYIDKYRGGADYDGDGVTTVEEYNEAIGYIDDDEDVDLEDYKLFFEYNMYWDLYMQYEEAFMNVPNVVEVTVAEDGSITVVDEGAMEFQMMESGVLGGQLKDEGIDSEYGITDDERLRAAWIPNYWIANSGMMGEYSEDHFMTQYRLFGDHFAPGIIDNKNWKISFNQDGSVLLVSVWADYDDSAALQLVKYTDEEGNERITMVGCCGELWQYSDILSNATVISPAYLYASEPVYNEPPHECVWGPWVDDDVTATHTRRCTFEGCRKKETQNHNWDNGVQTEAPTCTHGGIIIYTCAECKATRSNSIPELGHDWGEWAYYSVDSHIRTCKREGCGAEDNGGHEWGEWSAVDGNTHKMTCTVCNGEQNGEHDWDEGKITKEPTCKEDGVKTITCNTCLYSKTESIPSNGHKFGDWISDDETTHSRFCRCNEKETADHKFGEGVVINWATHIAPGEIQYTCEDCYYLKSETLPILPDHEWGEWVVNKVDEANTHIRFCICNESQTAPHNFDDGKITVETSHTASGEMQYTCGDCGYVKIQEIPPLPDHNFGDWTDNKDGTHIRFCSCGESETQPHNWTSWKEGPKVGFERECIDCGAYEFMELDEEKPVNTTPADNAAQAGLINTDIELIDKILTDEEQSEVAQGADVKVYLKVEDITNSVPAEDVAEVKTAAGENEIGMYLDIDLFKQIGEEEETAVTETSGKVTITITIPDELINTDSDITRTYKIIRVHEVADGIFVTDVIEGVFNAEDNTFTFETDKFSTYALAYADSSAALAGDTDGNNVVDSDDAIHLLYHVLFGADQYPVTQNADYDGNNVVDSDDAIHLLYHVLFGADAYPLKTK